MTTRRHFLCAASALFSAPALAAEAVCEVFTKDRQAAVTPAAAIQVLKDGNQRFVSGTPVNCDLMAQVRGTAGGQAPFAAVVGCLDSRASPEILFDQRIGDIFVARVAGNFVNTDILGSLEFATKVSGAKAIVILGHTDCGAIKGAIDHVHLGNLTATLANIRPSVAHVAKGKPHPNSKDREFVQAVAEQNVRDTAAKLMAKSPVLAELVAKKELAIAMAMHDLSTGTVTWMS